MKDKAVHIIIHIVHSWTAKEVCGSEALDNNTLYFALNPIVGNWLLPQLLRK